VAGQVALIGALNTQIDALGEVVAGNVGQHRDADIYTSQPGLGIILSAPILAEFGDDPDRYASVKARKNNAGTAPITRAPGISDSCLRNWMHQAEADANGGGRDEKKEVAELRRRNRVLEQENEILRRAAAYFARENVLPK
jgi:transposase-like protein